MKMTSTTLYVVWCRLLTAGVFLGVLLSPQWLKAQCDPRTSCINQVNVTMDANCKFTVSPSLVGFGACVGNYRVAISDGNPSNGNIIDCPGLWDYAVINGANEIVCWGKILAEDKSGPRLVSTDFVNTSLWCDDVNFVLNNPRTVGPTNTDRSLSNLITGSVIDTDVKNLGIPNFEDNCKSCGCVTTLKFSDRLENANCTETIVNGVYARIYRTFVATDCKGFTQSVEQVITFRRPTLNNFTFDFAGDANYKAIISYDACTANKSQIRRIDVTPYITNFWGKKIYLDSLNCNYGLNVSDTEFPICNGTGLKIERLIKLYDWCLNREVAQYKILIKLGDSTPPRVVKLSRIPTVSTSPFDCTASIPTTASGIRTVLGATISDNCSLGTLSVRVRTKGRIVSGITVDTTNWYNMNYPVSNGFITGLTVGRHRLIITANDGCYNTLLDSIEFFVRDQIAPVVKCDDDLRISLSNTPGFQTGYGKLTAEDVDEGSWDNCGKFRWLRVRRVIPSNCTSTFLDNYDTNGNGRIDPLPADGDWTKADGFDLNGDGDLGDFGETFILKEGKLMSPLRDFTEFYCCDLGAKVTIELWGEDLAGNRNYCWMDLQVEDKTAPICVAPWDVTIFCDDKCLGKIFDRAASAECFGDVNIQGGNDCTNLNVEYSVVSQVKCGKGYYIRRWTINKGAQSTTCEQRITVRPIYEYNIRFPSDIATDCQTASPDTTIADELGCETLAVNVSDKRYDASDGECYKIFRTYTIINWCAYNDRCGDPMASGKVYVVNRSTFNNDGKASLFVLVRDKNRDGTEEFWLSKDLLVDEVPNSRGDVDTRFTPPYCTASEEFYHSFMYTQIIKVEDNKIPVITVPTLNPFSTRPTDCLADVTITFRATDNCSPKIELELPQLMVAPNRTSTGPFIMYVTPRWSTVANADGSFTVTVRNLPVGKHDLIATVRDGCGNLSVPTRIPFEVKDTKAPAPICIKGLSIELMADQQGGGSMAVWANDFVASPIFDCNGQGEANAQGLKRVTKYSINRKGSPANVNNTGLVFTCADKGKIIEVEIHAWDEAGNHDFCITTVEVQDNQKICPGSVVDPVSIAGYVATTQNNMVKGVGLQLSGGALMQYTSGTDGTYNFAGLSKGKAYTLTPEMNRDFGNGITTIDLLYIQKHLINLQPITDPYLLIAADVDGSGHVSIGDQIRLRRFILNMIPDFGGTKSWRFLDAAYRFPDPANPWREAFPENIGMSNLDHNVNNANFVAIKIGDLNQSAIVNTLQVAETRTASTLKLKLEELILNPGATYEVPVRLSELQQIAGYQFALHWNTEALELVNLKPGVAKIDNFGIFAQDGQLTTSWIDQGQDKTAELFTLVFKAKRETQLSQVLQLNPRLMNAEAYNRNIETFGLSLDFGIATKATTAEMVLEQNQPNPFRSETQIKFWLPEAGEATLSIHDVTGRLVKTLRQNYSKGAQQVWIKDHELPSNGVYYYTLTQNGATATRKMVVTK
jgi:hypothetical protein